MRAGSTSRAQPSPTDGRFIAIAERAFCAVGSGTEARVAESLRAPPFFLNVLRMFQSGIAARGFGTAMVRVNA